MADIFISYRRNDSGGYAGRLYDRLRKRVGDDHVFFDVSTIALGQRWRDSLHEYLQRCRVVVAVVGPDWFSARDEQGRTRLANPDDVVRAEIVEADRAGKVMIPVLVGAAQLPAPETLPADWPEAVRGLGAHQAMRLDHDEFDADAERLETRLATLLPDLEFLALGDQSLAAQAGAIARRFAWPVGLSIVLTWATDAFFRQQGMDPLVARELGYVFSVYVVVTSVVAWGVRRLTRRASA